MKTLHNLQEGCGSITNCGAKSARRTAKAPTAYIIRTQQDLQRQPREKKQNNKSSSVNHTQQERQPHNDSSIRKSTNTSLWQGCGELLSYNQDNHQPLVCLQNHLNYNHNTYQTKCIFYNSITSKKVGHAIQQNWKCIIYHDDAFARVY